LFWLFGEECCCGAWLLLLLLLLLLLHGLLLLQALEIEIVLRGIEELLLDVQEALLHIHAGSWARTLLVELRRQVSLLD